MGSFREMPAMPAKKGEHLTALELWRQKLKMAEEQGNLFDVAAAKEAIKKIELDQERYGDA